MKEIEIPVEHTIEEPTETFGIVNSLCQWQETTRGYVGRDSGFNQGSITRLERDVDGEFYLSDVLAGYMTHPAALYQGKSIVARHQLVTDLIKFKKMIKESDKKYFLYTLNFEISFPRYTDIDPATFQVTSIDPIVNESRGWFVRYGVL